MFCPCDGAGPADDSEPALGQRHAGGRSAHRPFEASASDSAGLGSALRLTPARIACTRLTSLCEPDGSDRRLGVVVPRRGASQRTCCGWVAPCFLWSWRSSPRGSFPRDRLGGAERLLLGGLFDGLGAVLRAGLEVFGVLLSGLLGGVFDL